MTAPMMRDLNRPAEFRDKAHLAQWIADEAGVDVAEVRSAKKRTAKAAGQEWRANDPVGQIRQRALHRLKTTTIRNVARHEAGTVDPAPEARLTAPDSDTAARARRLMGGL